MKNDDELLSVNPSHGLDGTRWEYKYGGDKGSLVLIFRDGICKRLVREDSGDLLDEYYYHVYPGLWNGARWDFHNELWTVVLIKRNPAYDKKPLADRKCYKVIPSNGKVVFYDSMANMLGIKWKQEEA